MTGFPSTFSVDAHCLRGTTIPVLNFVLGKHRAKFLSMYRLQKQIKARSACQTQGRTTCISFNLISDTHLGFYENYFLCAEAMFHYRPQRETLAGRNINNKH